MSLVFSSRNINAYCVALFHGDYSFAPAMTTVHLEEKKKISTNTNLNPVPAPSKSIQFCTAQNCIKQGWYKHMDKENYSSCNILRSLLSHSLNRPVCSCMGTLPHQVNSDDTACLGKLFLLSDTRGILLPQCWPVHN